MTLPYSAEVLASFVARFNADQWPLHLFAAVLVLVALGGAWRTSALSDRAAGGALALLWAMCGGIYFWRGLTALSFIAPVYAGVFLVEAGLLAGGAALLGRLSFRRPGWVGGTLLIGALLVYPAAVALAEESRVGWRFAGMTPVPTTLFSLGLLAKSRGRLRWRAGLSVIPLFYLVAAAVSGWALL